MHETHSLILDEVIGEFVIQQKFIFYKLNRLNQCK